MADDRIYAHRHSRLEEFKFSPQVADVFEDMIRRSVPGYGLTLAMLSVLARKYGQAETFAYDLGCSLGASTLAMAQGLPDSVKIVALDNAPAMVEKCRTTLSKAGLKQKVKVVEQGIEQAQIEQASMVTLNFTLQFIPVAQRGALLSRVFEGLNPGGILVLSEKIIFPDAQEQNLLNELHLEFKKEQGYSDLEISQKRQALENVLTSQTLEEHTRQLEQAGFKQVVLWMQCFNFVSLVAVK